MEGLRWLLAAGCLFALFLAIRQAYTDPTMKRSSRLIRIVGGGLWAVMIIAGMLARLFGGPI